MSVRATTCTLPDSSAVPITPQIRSPLIPPNTDANTGRRTSLSPTKITSASKPVPNSRFTRLAYGRLSSASTPTTTLIGADCLAMTVSSRSSRLLSLMALTNSSWLGMATISPPTRFATF
ncbi:hypothetical protein [Moraxella lacunata]|uniref:hypothetical protein n=1 Tax=Moraxella lacunata TaxID=477 RepID=UPI003EE36CCB